MSFCSNLLLPEPVVIFALMSELLEQYAEVLTRVEHLVFSDAYRRVISVLLYLAKQFGEEKDGGVIVNHRFTQQDIATLVGVARETASNEIIKLEKKGLVEYIDHSILFKSISKLNSELTSSGKSL